MIDIAILCMALNIYWEARSEPLQGQHYVAQVTFNRADRDPAKVCEVVFKPYQFSWANPLTTSDQIQRASIAHRFIPKEKKAWWMAKDIARWTVKGYIPDVTGGATHFHTNYIRKPRWARGMRHLASVGAHHFYADAN